ncbi:MAG: type II toxin-antitoxin system RelE/ParE family toxin [Chloroflexi bacterium]|nr:type II toxin-antitoxin system RelE/ParE family toxin [Chloroflexota bacterium]
MHTVVEMENFSSSAKAANVTENEVDEIVSYLALNPTVGRAIPRTGGARKFRYRSRGRGKRGGYRVITFYTGTDIPVFLIDIFAKGDKIDLTMRERNELKMVLGQVAEAYRRRQR